MRPDSAIRAYRILLRLAPRRLRDRHAEEMFADALAQAEASGRRAVVAAWVSAAPDVASAVAREPFRRSPIRRESKRKPIMFGSDLRYAARWLLRQRFSTAPRWNLDVVGINYPDFHHWRQHVESFEGIAIWDEATFNLSEDGSAERIEGVKVTHDFASVLQINPIVAAVV